MHRISARLAAATLAAATAAMVCQGCSLLKKETAANTKSSTKSSTKYTAENATPNTITAPNTPGKAPTVAAPPEGKRRAASQLMRDFRRRLDAAGVKAQETTDSLGLPALRIVLADPDQIAEPNVTGYNSATQAAAESVAAILAEGGTALYVLVEGHTDNVGPWDENMTVSRKRAKAVGGLLVRKGVMEDRVTTVGRSFDVPIGDNHLIEGRALNRRVEIVIHTGAETWTDLGLM